MIVVLKKFHINIINENQFENFPFRCQLLIYPAIGEYCEEAD